MPQLFIKIYREFEDMTDFHTDDKPSSKAVMERFAEVYAGFVQENAKQPSTVRFGSDVMSVLLTEASERFSTTIDNIVEFHGLKVEKADGDTIEVL